jgi:DNA-binding GntR family transcriptional regulator
MTERPPKATLSETAYNKLRDRIITLELKPGAQINERGLERELSIGRTPVREAFLRLVNEGFLRSVPGRGFFVCEITIEGVRALFEAVMILERGSMALAALRITAGELNRLQGIHQGLKAAMKKRQYLEITLLNSQFHRIIHEASRNHFLMASLYNLAPQYHRLAYLCFSEETEPYELRGHFAKVTEDHEQLIQCLESRDERGAVEAVTRHVGLFHARVTRYMFPPMQAIEAAAGLRPPGRANRRRSSAGRAGRNKLQEG